MKRPTFFISSTIYDFQDLRSALKFYLEEQGCRVLASEYNDFTKPLDMHSYEACLSSIHDADYFILLVGARVGGWYNETDRISITQREYREAYELQSEGKLKLFNFVRAPVWQVRQDRNELTSYLKSLPIEPGLRKTIVNFPSKFADDAKFISKFISEVARNKETKLAVKGEGEAPTGNWVHVFSDFKDIADVLQGQLFSSTPIEDLTMQRLLRRELYDFLIQCLMKSTDGSVGSPRNSIEKFHRDTPISLEDLEKKTFKVPAKRWDLISYISMGLLSLHLHPVVLSQAISLPTFLRFDLMTSSYQETPAYEALLKLLNEIRRFNHANSTRTLNVVIEYSKATFPRDGDFISIDTMKLYKLLHLFDRWINVIELSQSLLWHLDGKAFQMPSLRPDSPIKGMQDQLDNERPTTTDIDDYLSVN